MPWMWQDGGKGESHQGVRPQARPRSERPGAAEMFTCGECGRACALAEGLEGRRRAAHVRLFVPADSNPAEDEDGANEQDGVDCVVWQALPNGEAWGAI